MFMLAGTFARRMQLLIALGYRVLSLTEAVDRANDRSLPPDSVVITIDDGWYGTYKHMLPVLQELQLPATLYCDTANLERNQVVPHVMATYLRKAHCGDALLPPTTKGYFHSATDFTSSHSARFDGALAFACALGIEVKPYFVDRVFNYMTAEEMRDAARRGLDVQLHTHTHSLHDMARSHVAREIAANRAALARVLGTGPDVFTHFCYPSGVASKAAAATLRDLGIRTATTLQSGLCREHGQDLLFLPRIVDGSHQSDIEFEADLAGAGNWHRYVAQHGPGD